jgi:hypothetical protein
MTTETENPTDKYLAQMLEGYEKGLESITEFIDNHREQLEGATARREEMISEIAQLKELLGISEEAK